jgi:hypothetical protein
MLSGLISFWTLSRLDGNPALAILPALALSGFVFLTRSFEIQLGLLLVLSYLPGHQLLAIIPWILLLKEVVTNGMFRVHWVEAAFLGWMLVSLVFNDGRVDNFLHYLIASFYWWAILRWLQYQQLPDALFGSVIKLLLALQLLQFFFVSTQIAMVWPNTHGDNAQGTMMGVNIYLGAKSILMLLVSYFLWRETKRPLFMIFFLAFAATWIMTGLKTSVIAALLVVFFNILRGRYPLAIKIIGPVLIIATVASAVFFIDSDFREIFKISKWIGNIGKVKIFKDTFRFLFDQPFHLVFGLGPGQFLSRTALISSGGLETGYSGLFSLVPSALQSKIIYATYTRELYEATYGAVLYSPNSSIVAAFTELGIPGFFLLAGGIVASFLSVAKRATRIQDPVLRALARSMVTFALVMLPLGFIDYWMEYPTVIFPVLLLYEYFRRVSQARSATVNAGSVLQSNAPLTSGGLAEG